MQFGVIDTATSKNRQARENRKLIVDSSPSSGCFYYCHRVCIQFTYFLLLLLLFDEIHQTDTYETVHPSKCNIHVPIIKTRIQRMKLASCTQFINAILIGLPGIRRSRIIFIDEFHITNQSNTSVALMALLFSLSLSIINTSMSGHE